LLHPVLSDHLVGAGHAIARIGTMRFTAYAMVVASAASLLQFAVMRPLSALDLPLRVYEYSIAMAIFSTVLPVFLLSFAIRRIGSGSASLIASIGPVKHDLHGVSGPEREHLAAADSDRRWCWPVCSSSA
jgi:threonine/homoserine efflux transporter RhtA